MTRPDQAQKNRRKYPWAIEFIDACREIWPGARVIRIKEAADNG